MELAFDPDTGLVAHLMEPYPPATKPTTVTDLLKLDPTIAGQQLEDLIRSPLSEARGLELLRQYLAAMSKKQAKEMVY